MTRGRVRQKGLLLYVIPRLVGATLGVDSHRDRGIQSFLDTPVKPEYDGYYPIVKDYDR
ncbi:MAG: hypothetical protein M1508_11150 [Nitrospirae bacterium]|nr:hypothetical protein [Nitrospirota bacterium]